MKNSFKNWLLEEKNFKNKSAGDVISRIKRIDKTINSSDQININELTLSELDSNLEFQKLSTHIKSQLRRALTLFIEYKTNNQD